MSEQDFDEALIAAAFRLAADEGWSRFTIADAAKAAHLPLARARADFPSKHALLRRFGRKLDQAALSAALGEGSTREQLFELLMARFDGMKPHREGIHALLRYLPTDPATTLQLACGTRRSMRWMLNVAGQSTSGLRGALRIRGLAAIWLWTLRTFERDESEDLSATMAALDTALTRAQSLTNWLPGHRSKDAEPDESAVPDEAEPLS